MEAPHLDLTSELLGVFSADRGSSESGDNGGQSPERRNQNAYASYVISPRKAKFGPGEHKKTVTKRTRLPLNWKRVRTFAEEVEAQTFIQSFEGYNWRKGCNNKTSGGLKCYYICKENSLCKVMSLLHYDSKTNQIDMYQSDRPHYHEPTPRDGAPESSNGTAAVNEEIGLASTGASSTSCLQSSLLGDTKLFQAEGASMNGSGTDARRSQNLRFIALNAKKPGTGRRRGLSDETAAIINRLFTMDPHIKPSQVQEELKRSGIPLLQNYHINNFLAKLRKQLKQAGETAAASAQLHGKRSSGRARQPPARFSEECEGRSGLMMNGRTDYYSDDANNSSTTDTWFNNPNPMSMVDINLTNPFEDDSEGEDAEDGFMDDNELFNPPSHSIADEDGDMLLGLNDSMSVTITGNQKPRRNSGSLSPLLPTGMRSLAASGSGATGRVPTSTTPGTGLKNNQSEVVSTSSMARSRKRNFYFRDESTKEGDNISPNEDNIKGLIVRHIQDNYSNRDMLHIREELRTLKDMKKFRALNRLLSFTAGFLQDSFIDVTSNATNGNGRISPKLPN